MDDEQRANQQEFDKLHQERHSLNRQIAQLEKITQEQGAKIRHLEGVIRDAIEFMKAGLD